MTNVVQIRTGGEQATPEVNEPERRLAESFGVDPRRLRDAIRPLFLLMHDQGINIVSVARDGGKAVVTVDGKLGDLG